MTEFGKVTQGKHVSRSQPRPHPNGRGSSVHKLFGTPTYVETVLPRATKFGVPAHVGE